MHVHMRLMMLVHSMEVDHGRTSPDRAGVTTPPYRPIAW